ncbi:hypothetical protein M9H77_05532 [Catharanthus roseus]|uniref:Uncharacterized protein n=1 Tax=Catharanthus roseus TaxID=4058 RepID=A0ACC0CH65_CATRO|nr:hypothetical protein M9H77_05532 [Catharanthus roseus]
MQPNPIFSILITIITIAFVKSFSQEQQLFLICDKPFICGNLSFNYPFYGGSRPSSCGYPGFQLTCERNVTFLAFTPLRYRVLAIDGSKQSLIVARDDLWSSSNLCPRFNENTTFDSSIFSYSSGYKILTLSFGCAILNPNLQREKLKCPANTGTNVTFFNSTKSLGINQETDIVCKNKILIPINGNATQNIGTPEGLRVAVSGGFGLEWRANNRDCDQCSQSGGRCGYNSNTSSFVCFCSDGPYDLVCNSKVYMLELCALQDQRGILVGGESLLKLSPIYLYAALSLGTTGLIFSVAALYLLVKRCSLGEGIIWGKPGKESNQNIEAFIRSYGSLAPKCYSFQEIKKMTDSFAHLLGQGGYGSVYKGTLPDGRPIAIKVLRDNKGNGEEFINEVASISRTSHVNVVTLLGFCYKANTRALVYEFMSNGSLDKFLHKNGLDADADCRLEWKVSYQIALGTARGLDYLHQGCNTRIVHFDIKPQNILLDDDFCPKISDFGLAKLCKKKDSRVQVDTDKSSETYFPNWIYERLELEKDLRLEGLMNAEDEEDARKMIMVGLWCIQTKPSDRPSMSKVVEMLEGSIQSLQIPPKPYLLDSPAAIRSLEESSSETLSSYK